VMCDVRCAMCDLRCAAGGMGYRWGDAGGAERLSDALFLLT